MILRLIQGFKVDTPAALREDSPGIAHYHDARLMRIARECNNRRLDRVKRHGQLAARCCAQCPVMEAS